MEIGEEGMRKRRAEEVNKSWPNVRGSIPDNIVLFFKLFLNYFSCILKGYSYYGYGFMDPLTDGSAYSGMVTPSVILRQLKK